MYKSNIRNLDDQGAKLIFGNADMCAQFLNDYIDIDCLKGLKPEQIEDITSRFVSMWDNERDSDIVKRIHLNAETNLYVITIIEHQSRVDYTMAMKILRYMVMIWTEYEREQDELYSDISKTKDFKYPPILPIVYFEGTGAWSAAKHLSERIALAEVFGEYLPDFRYEVIRIHDYTNDEIISKGNEFSLVMLVNKLKDSEDIRNLKQLPKDYLENLQNKSSDYLLELIATIVSAFMHRLQIEQQEIADLTDMIRERRFSMLFDSFEAYSVPEIREKSTILAKVEDMLFVLSEKGNVSDALKEKILSQNNIGLLNEWFKIAVKSSSIEEFENQILKSE